MALDSMAFCNYEWILPTDPIPDMDALLNITFKRKFRWRMIIPDISASGVNSLPPLKSARPSLSFKDITVEHLNETITFPGKPEWKEVNLTLYDICKGTENVVMTWIRRQYDLLNCSKWQPCLESPIFKVAEVYLELYDGCGNVLEKWVFEGIYCKNIEFGDLEMSSSDVILCDLTLKYDRAYIINATAVDLNLPSIITDFSCTAISTSYITPSFIPFAMSEGVNMPEFKQIRF